MTAIQAIYKKYVERGNRIIFRAMGREITAREAAGIAYYAAAAATLTPYIQ